MGRVKRGMRRGWTTVLIRKSLKARILRLSSRLDDAYTEGRSDVPISDVTGTITPNAVIDRAIREYEEHLIRSNSRRKSSAGSPPQERIIPPPLAGEFGRADGH